MIDHQACFYVDVETSSEVFYQWEYSDRNGWHEIEGANAPDYNCPATDLAAVWSVRCHIWDNHGNDIYTNEATIIVNEYNFFITIEPESVEVSDGDYFDFQVDVDSYWPEYYQWYVCQDGENWVAIEGATQNCYGATASLNMNGWQYCCHIQNDQGEELESRIATLIVGYPNSPSIISDWTHEWVDGYMTAQEGENINLWVSVDTTDAPDVYYQWERRTDDTDWQGIEGANSDTYTFTASSSDNGFVYRCEVWDDYGYVEYTCELKLFVGLTFITQPVNATAVEGYTGNVSFYTSAVSPFGGVSYLWQYYDISSAEWMNIDWEVYEHFSPQVGQYESNQFRCVVSDEAGNSIISNEVIVCFETPYIELINFNEELVVNAGADFYPRVKVNTLKNNHVYLQWEMRSGDSEWETLTEVYNYWQSTENYITVKARATYNGCEIRCHAWDDSGNDIYSSSTVVTVNFDGVYFLKQPEDQYVDEYTDAVFTVAAEGTGTVSYQWQTFVDDESGWEDLEGENSDTLIIPANVQDTQSFRCVVTDVEGTIAYSREAYLYLVLYQAPTIVDDWTSDWPEGYMSVTEGEYVAVWINVDNPRGVNYYSQWEYYMNGSGWTPIEGETSDGYGFEVTLDDDNKEIRCHIWDEHGNEEYSNSISMLVVPYYFCIMMEPEDQDVIEGDYFEFFVDVDTCWPTYYQWYVSKDCTTWEEIDGAVGNCYGDTGWGDMSAWQYKCHIWDDYGHDVYSGVATLTVECVDTLYLTGAWTEEWHEGYMKANEGDTVTLWINADIANGSEIFYQWQKRTDDSDWVDIEGKTSDTYILDVSSSDSGFTYRCAFWNNIDFCDYSPEMKLYVGVFFTLQPVDYIMVEGYTGQISLHSLADSVSGYVSYQWQYYDINSAEWTDILNETNSSFYPYVGQYESNHFRCIASDDLGNHAISNEVSITFEPAYIDVVSYSSSNTVNGGVRIPIRVDVSCPKGHLVHIQWEGRLGDSEWLPINETINRVGPFGQNIGIIARAENDGYEYRCHGWDDLGNESYSESVTITVVINNVFIYEEPVDQDMNEYTEAVFHVAAEGNGSVTYQWQHCLEGEDEWTDIEGETSDTLRFSGDTENQQVRCVVMDEAGTTAISCEAYLWYSPYDPPTIMGDWTYDWADGYMSAFKGDTIDLYIDVDNPCSATYYCQWEYQLDGSGWLPIEGATSELYSLTVSADDNNKEYRCHIWDEHDNEEYSNSIRLEVRGDGAIKTIEYNGHTYTYYKAQMSWEEARMFCEDKGGYLMTITTAAEQDILVQLNEDDEGIFIGGYRVNEDNWAWVTGEAFTYTNWNEGEPNNGLGIEPEIYIGAFVGTGSGWNDFPENPTDVAGFVMEVGPTDPIPTRSAELNGHKYFFYNTYLPWQDAKVFCEDRGGYLMTITSQAEQDILVQFNETDEGIFIGGYRIDEDDWAWVTGEDFSYTNWNEGEPNNGLGIEPEIYAGAFVGTRSCWNDFPENPTDVVGFVMEVGDVVTEEPPTFTLQPTDQRAWDGITVSFSAEAVAESEVSYQWQFSVDEETWTDIDGATDRTYTFVYWADLDGYYRCKATAVSGAAAYSDVARTDIFMPQLWIVTNPADIEVIVGGDASFTVEAEGEGPEDEYNIYYQWQYDMTDDGVDDWVNISGAYDSTYWFTPEWDEDGYIYRCEVSDDYGTVIWSDVARLTVFDDGPAYQDNGYCGDNLTWTLDWDGVLQIYGDGDMVDYPDFLSTPWYSYRDEVTALILPDGITSIGNYAFRNMDSMTGINSLPDSVTRIGYEAFDNTKIEGPFYISQYVTEIGESAFGSCVYLTEFIVNENNVYYTAVDGILYTADMSVLLQCPVTKTGEFVIPQTVTRIGDSAFAGMYDNMTGDASTLLRDSNVTEIGPFGFWRCQQLIGDLILPEGLRVVGRASFLGDYSLTGVEFPSTLESLEGAAFSDCRNLTYVLFNGQSPTMSSWEATFNGCAENFTIYCRPEYAESFMSSDRYDAEAGTWYGYPLEILTDLGRVVDRGSCGTNLTWTLYSTGDLVISGTGEMYNYGLGGAPWYQYRNTLSSLNLEYGITYIGRSAFQECIGLGNTLIIPDSVTGIGEAAFEECKGFTGLVLSENLVSIPEWAFGNCSGMEGELYIPASVQSIGTAAFVHCIGFSGEVEIPSGVTTIGSWAFQDCPGITSLKIGDNVSFIETGAFYECSNLERVEFYGVAPEMGDLVFGACAGGITLYCCEGNADSFYNSSNYDGSGHTWYGYPLEVLIDPSRVVDSGTCGTNLTWTLYDNGELVFAGYGAMTDYNSWYWSSPETSAPWAEYKEQITSVVLPEGITRVGNGAFYGFAHLSGDLVIPESITEIGDNAFGFTGYVGALSLPSGLISIGNGAFTHTGFTGSLVIPESLTNMGQAAFQNCNGFTGSVYIPRNMTGGYNAFSNCSGINEFVVHVQNTTYAAYDGLLYDKNYRYLQCCPSGKTDNPTIYPNITGIDSDAFTTISFEGPLVIPDGTVQILAGAFYESNLAGNLDLPASVSYMERAFINCPNLESVTFLGEAPNVSGSVAFVNVAEGFVVRCYVENKGSFTSSSAYNSETGTWCGYPLEVIGEDEAIETFEDGVKLNAKSVSLSGNIGVNLKMTVPEQYVDSSYMTFTVHGRTTTIQTNTLEPNSKGQYVFTAYVTSIEMAEQIQAVFTYGDFTATMTYSVADYIQAYEEVSGNYAAEITSLVHALADYGHHAQTFLSKYRTWTIGKQYTEMSGYSETYTAEELAAAQADVANYALTYTTNANIEKVNISLNLESETSIYVYLTPTSDYTGKVTCAEGYTVEKIGARYRVTIPNIMAHQLGNTYTLHLTTTAGTIEVNVSALSYANSIFNSDAMGDVDRYFAVALYNYYQSAVAYLN